MVMLLLLVAVSFCALVGTHLVCQNAREQEGMRWEAVVGLGCLIAVIWSIVFLTDFSADLFGGTQSTPKFAYFGVLAAIGLVSLLALAARRHEKFESHLIWQFALGAFLIAVLSIPINWLPEHGMKYITKAIIALTGVSLAMLAIFLPEIPGRRYTFSVGLVTGLIVLEARRGTSLAALQEWYLALAGGLIITSAIYVALTTLNGRRIKVVTAGPMGRFYLETGSPMTGPRTRWDARIMLTTAAVLHLLMLTLS